MDNEKIYRKCFLIRRFEEMIESEFEKGTMRGTTHGCMGQEMIPVLLMELADKERDYITGTHRSHGQVLAYTEDPYRLACEMMGKRDGFNQGMGGSQHIRTGHYITNGVTGGMACVGTGMALSMKKRGDGGIVMAFLGDGGFYEGYVQECLNLAQVMELPILFVCENNQYAMSTRTADFSAGTIPGRVSSMGMETETADCRALKKLESSIKKAYDFVKEKQKPYFLEIMTFRLCGHSKSDRREYMSEEEKQEYVKQDPLKRLKEKLSEQTAVRIEQEVNCLLKEVFDKAHRCQEM